MVAILEFSFNFDVVVRGGTAFTYSAILTGSLLTSSILIRDSKRTVR